MKIKKFQTGGTPEQVQGQEVQKNQQGNPEEQLAQIAEQLLSQLGPEACMVLIQMLTQMLQQMQQQAQPQGQPQYQKQGGKLVYKGRK